jgi:hypothetical protein
MPQQAVAPRTAEKSTRSTQELESKQELCQKDLDTRTDPADGALPVAFSQPAGPVPNFCLDQVFRPEDLPIANKTL